MEVALSKLYAHCDTISLVCSALLNEHFSVSDTRRFSMEFFEFYSVPLTTRQWHLRIQVTSLGSSYPLDGVPGLSITQLARWGPDPVGMRIRYN